MIRKLLKAVIGIMTVAMVFGLFYYFNPKPCVSPISYRIGTFDARFDISREDFLDSVQQAAEIWSKAAGKTLFVYDPKGKVTIDLIYDERQQTTENNKVLQADIEEIGKLASLVKEQYEALENDLRSKKTEYEEALSRFDSASRSYENQVAYWNERGGAPSNEYQKLIVQKQELEATSSSLERKRLALNAQVDQVNAFIQKYNLLARSANKTITTINSRAGQEFQEGTYDPNTRTMTIYEFSTNYKLLRILAHEFGHALSLDHNNNPSSIMYELNQSNTLTLSKEDLRDLQALCAQ